MRKKLLALAVVLIIIMAVPIVIAQIVQYSQSIHVTGTASYPRQENPPTTPTPTPMPTAGSTVKFSLYFPNGTSIPSNAANFITPAVYGPMDKARGDNPSIIVVHNDGNTPINIATTALNVNVPSDVNFILDASGAQISNLAVGQSANLYVGAVMTISGFNYPALQPFSYSFDISITATQA